MVLQSAGICRICLHVLLAGPYLPLVFLFAETYLKYFVYLYLVSSLIAEVLPKRIDNQDLKVFCVSFFIALLSWYYILNVDIPLNFILSLSVITFNYFIIPFLCGLVRSAIQTVTIWIKLRNDILKKYKTWKKYLYVCIWCFDKLLMVLCFLRLLYSLSNAVDFFYEDHGLKEINIADIETNDCIPYTSFPDQLWFSNSDVEESVSLYHVNESLTFLSAHFVVTEELTNSMREDSKLCKTYEGEDFFVTFNTTLQQHSFGHSVEYYWTFNGTRIGTSTFHNRGKYGFWYKHSGDLLTVYFLINEIIYNDAGKYVLHRKTKELYTFENKSVKRQLVYPGKKQFSVSEKSEIIVDRKVLKFCLVNYYNSVTAYRDVGTLIEINKFFKISKFHEKIDQIEPLYLINRRDIKEVCPLNTSCNPTVGLYHNKDNYYKQRKEEEYPMTITEVNVSFCVCPEAYGIHEFYFKINDYFYIRFPLILNLQPPRAIFHSTYYLAMLECCDGKDSFECMMGSYWKKSVFNSDMKERFIQQGDKEKLLIIMVFVSFCVIVILIDKLQNVLIYWIYTDQTGNISKQDISKKSFDIFLSYCTEDRHFSEQTLSSFLKHQLGYKVFTQEDILGNRDTRHALKDFISACKTFILVISKDYLDNNMCFKWEYEMALLISVAESRIAHKNVLIIKYDDCRSDVDPLTRFQYIDWTDTLLNVRTEEEKKDELQRWLYTRLKPSTVWLFLSKWILEPGWSFVRWFYYAGH